MNSRNKGARGEREAAKYLTKLGFEASRNGRNGYSTDDLRCPGLPNLMIEVKFGYASMDIHTACLRKAWEQAAFGAGWSVVSRTSGIESKHGDGVWSLAFSASAWYERADSTTTPVVLWRPLRKPWRLTWMDSCGLVTTTGDEAIKTKLLELNGAANAAER